jgi:hypothetical protein
VDLVNDNLFKNWFGDGETKGLVGTRFRHNIRFINCSLIRGITLQSLRIIGRSCDLVQRVDMHGCTGIAFMSVSQMLETFHYWFPRKMGCIGWKCHTTKGHAQLTSIPWLAKRMNKEYPINGTWLDQLTLPPCDNVSCSLTCLPDLIGMLTHDALHNTCPKCTKEWLLCSDIHSACAPYRCVECGRLGPCPTCLTKETINQRELCECGIWMCSVCPKPCSVCRVEQDEEDFIMNKRSKYDKNVETAEEWLSSHQRF